MTLLFLFLILAATLLLAMAFSFMETVSLLLNRNRLIHLFSEEADDDLTEQDIIKETKEIYLITRLGLSASLVFAGFVMVHFWKTFLINLPGIPWENHAFWIAGFGATLIILPPLYVFFVYVIPRLLIRQTSLSAGDTPRWFMPFVRIAKTLGPLARVLTFPLQGIFQHQQLTKTDLMTLIMDLAPEEEEEEESDSDEANDEEEPDEEEIIYNILDMEETLVREVMKPINRVLAVRLGRATVADLRHLSRLTGYSRFPVYREHIVDLVGYVNIYDILRNMGEGRPLEDYVTPAYYVPEFMRVSQLLQEFLQRKIQVAVVVDEYGGCSGWITREDVMEELVGEIEDEFDRREKEPVTRLNENSWLITGACHVEDLPEDVAPHLGESDEERQYDTLAGYILMQLGHIPQPGERVETSFAEYQVSRMEGNRVAEVRVYRREEREDEAE